MSDSIKIITKNRKARHEFHIEDSLEAGIVLVGTEVKSVREGRLNLQDAYCRVVDNEMLLLQCHISPFKHGNRFNHDPLRPRKLLLHRKEIAKYEKASEQKGYSIVPLKVYLKNGRVKVEIGLGKGKKLYDKRTDMAERDSRRQLERVMKSGSATD